MFASSVLWLLAVWFTQGISGGDIVYVNCTQGMLAGETLQTNVTNITYHSFKGIPYAKPPVGPLRFLAPQEPDCWDGVRNATVHGPVSPQTLLLTGEYLPGSEDCLFLNVYTRNLTGNQSVIVSIPGGAYLFGSGDDDIYGPAFLISKGVVLVTLNYRLDALGFLSMNTCEVPGNAGLKDQVAALKWVQKNIKYFGGNSESVTIIGESAAAGAVGYHLLSPMSKNLFHRAIAMSGSPLRDWNTSFKPERRAFILGEKLGLKTNNKTELLLYLQSLSYDKLVGTTNEVMASETLTNVIFKMEQYPPVIEKECPQDSFLTKDPRALLESGNVNKVDVMFSYNAHEALYAQALYEEGLLERYNRYPELLVPSTILLNCTANKILELSDKIKKHFFGEKTISIDNMPEFINYVSSLAFIYHTQKFAKKWPNVGRKYMFKFTATNSTRDYYGLQAAKYNITGISQFDDVFHIYEPKSLNMELDTDSDEYQIIELITSAISNFAKYGNPTPDSSSGVHWPQYNASTLAYMDFDNGMAVKYALDESDYEFWASICDEAGMSY